MQSICYAPISDKSEIENRCTKLTVGNSHHCEFHRSICNPVYLKYKHCESRIQEYINQNRDLSEETINTLLKIYSRLEKCYNLRVKHRQIAYVKETWNFGHHKRLTLLLNALVRIDLELQNRFNDSKLETSNKELEQIEEDKTIDLNSIQVVNLKTKKILQNEDDWKTLLYDMTKFRNDQIEIAKKLAKLFEITITNIIKEIITKYNRNTIDFSLPEMNKKIDTFLQVVKEDKDRQIIADFLRKKCKSSAKSKNQIKEMMVTEYDLKFRYKELPVLIVMGAYNLCKRYLHMFRIKRLIAGFGTIVARGNTIEKYILERFHEIDFLKVMYRFMLTKEFLFLIRQSVLFYDGFGVMLVGFSELKGDKLKIFSNDSNGRIYPYIRNPDIPGLPDKDEIQSLTLLKIEQLPKNHILHDLMQFATTK